MEDAFIWFENGKFYCIAKDFQGYFTKAGRAQLALFECEDGISWQPAEHALAFTRSLTWEDGSTLEVRHLERPQLYVENGKPVCLRCACAFYEDIEEVSQSSVISELATSAALDLTPMTHTFNICIPIIK